MRILIATCNRALVGGVEMYLKCLVPPLRLRGHDVALLYEQPVHAGQPLLDETFTTIPRWTVAELGQQEVLHQIADWKPDVVYLQGLLNPHLELALAERYPTVLFAHGYHGTCVSGTKAHAFPQGRPCERKFGPMCLALYFPRRCGGLSPLTMWQQYQVQKLRGTVLASCRAVLVASRHMRTEYLRHGLPEDRVHLLPLFPAGLSPESAPPAERSPTGRILCVGRLTHIKGGELLLQAVVRAGRALGRELTLVLAGDGPYRAHLEQQAARLGVHVEFLGWVDAARRTELMRQADLLAVPSVWPEPFGLVGIEAGCVGLPAVAFAVGGIPDWLVASASGEIAPGDPPTSQGLAEAFVRALKDPTHWNRLRHGAWRLAQQFSADTHVAGLETILEWATRKEAVRA